jgi:hypothetical protein
MTHTYMPVQQRAAMVATVPWEIFTPEDQTWAQKNHGGQTLEELAGRGGLDICELIAVLDHRPFRHDRWVHAWARLWEIIAERGTQFKPRH